MKKYLLICTLACLSFSPKIVEASEKKVHTSTKSIDKYSDGGRKSKDGRYHRSKGFMWGLFKGKNQCDCPKH